MRILIAEDDLTSRRFMLKFLSQYGECDLTVDGLEALDAFLLSINEKRPYDLVCLDIMMPKVDGVRALKTIRALEKDNGVPPANGVKVIMITALGESEYVRQAFAIGCEAYVAKPVDTEKFGQIMEKLGFERKAV